MILKPLFKAAVAASLGLAVPVNILSGLDAVRYAFHNAADMALRRDGGNTAQKFTGSLYPRGLGESYGQQIQPTEAGRPGCRGSAFFSESLIFAKIERSAGSFVSDAAFAAYVFTGTPGRLLANGVLSATPLAPFTVSRSDMDAMGKACRI